MTYQSGDPHTKPSHRFGVAMSKIRSMHRKKVIRQAKKFLRSARACDGTFNGSVRLNRAWIAGANLKPVLDFLAGK